MSGKNYYPLLEPGMRETGGFCPRFRLTHRNLRLQYRRFVIWGIWQSRLQMFSKASWHKLCLACRIRGSFLPHPPLANVSIIKMASTVSYFDSRIASYS